MRLCKSSILRVSRNSGRPTERSVKRPHALIATPRMAINRFMLAEIEAVRLGPNTPLHLRPKKIPSQESGCRPLMVSTSFAEQRQGDP